MGAGVLSTSLVEMGPFGSVRSAWAAVTAGTAEGEEERRARLRNGAPGSDARAAPPRVVPLPRSGDPAELRRAVEATAARHDFARTFEFESSGREYVMLGTEPGMITATGTSTRSLDVISGVFTGCLMGVYLTGDGFVYICHVYADGRSDSDCKARWRFMTMNEPGIKEAYHFTPSTARDLLTRADLEQVSRLGGVPECWGVIPGDDLTHPFVVVTVRPREGAATVLRRFDVPDQASGTDRLGLHWRGDDDY